MCWFNQDPELVWDINLVRMEIDACIVLNISQCIKKMKKNENLPLFLNEVYMFKLVLSAISNKIMM